MTKFFQKNTFLLSLILHLLLFTSLIFISLNSLDVKPEQSHALYIPSYTYSNNELARNSKPFIDNNTSENGIEKPVVKTEANAQNLSQAIQYFKNEQGVHFIGNKKLRNQLIKLLGIAITAHLVYPKSAIDFRIKGIVEIGFVINPNGDITDVRLLKSSGAGVLDEAALSAANKIGTIKDVSRYISQQKFIEFGIVFR